MRGQGQPQPWQGQDLCLGCQDIWLINNNTLCIRLCMMEEGDLWGLTDGRHLESARGKETGHPGLAVYWKGHTPAGGLQKGAKRTKKRLAARGVAVDADAAEHILGQRMLVGACTVTPTQ